MNLRSVSQLKQQLRQKMREQRADLSSAELEAADQQLAKQYQQLFACHGYQKVALYLQQDNELGTRHLMNYLFAEGCELYLPKLSQDGNSQMYFCRFQQDSEMVNNRFDIPEPVADEISAVTDIELLLVPLTAFDMQGNRLGMGGGYYDKCLAEVDADKTSVVGLAYDFQQVADCPVEDFDQPLPMVLTPSRIIDFITAEDNRIAE